MLDRILDYFRVIFILQIVLRVLTMLSPGNRYEELIRMASRYIVVYMCLYPVLSYIATYDNWLLKLISLIRW